MFRHPRIAGFTFVELLVVAALTTLIFGALFSSFQYTLRLVNESRAKLSVVSLANDRMEYFRSLPYAEVGTISGIPPGTIPQNSTTTLNGIIFQERVLVEYVDDDADGVGASDTNGIVSDYKRVKVEYTWSIGNSTSSLALISNIVPRSVETTTGGGTVRINVLNSNSTLLPGASVRLLNRTTTSTVDVTRITDATGVALFSGAPAASSYEVIVNGTIAGEVYSTSQTYEATTTNPNPTVAPFAVLESDVSTLTFQIDALSDMAFETLSTITEGSIVEPFSGGSGIASSTDVAVGGGELRLRDTAGVYESSGVAYLEAVTPSPLETWESIRVAADIPGGSSYRVQLFTGASTTLYELIPDSDVPGNGAGFTSAFIDISELDSATYPSIVVGILLETINPSFSPLINEVAVYYRESSAALSGATLNIVGDKTIGTELDATPIFKTATSVVTDAGGEAALSNMEFDTYTITPSGGYDVALSCPSNPFTHRAGIDSDVSILLVGNAASTLRVEVRDALQRPIPGATVRLERGGYDVTTTSGSCGQVFFTGGVSDASDYTLTVSQVGYTTETLTSFSITGDTVTAVTLIE